MIAALNGSHSSASREFSEFSRKLMAALLVSGENAEDGIEIIEKDSAILAGPRMIVEAEEEPKTVVVQDSSSPVSATTSTANKIVHVHVEKIPTPEVIKNVQIVEIEEEEETEEVVEAEGEEEEETEEVVEEEETEEVVVEETEEEVVEEETEEVVEAEGEEEEETEEEVVEEAEGEEEEETEEAEEEEGGLEAIKIGKKMYFVDTASQAVYAYVNEEEAGDAVGKLVGGKLVLN